MVEDFNDNKKLISEFNEAGFQILRLHEYWNDCGKYSRDGNYDKWKWTLDVIWLELYADAIVKNEDKYVKELKLRDKMVELAKGKNQLYYALKKKQEFLKKLQDDVGKGGKRREEFGDMF